MNNIWELRSCRKISVGTPFPTVSSEINPPPSLPIEQTPGSAAPAT